MKMKIRIAALALAVMGLTVACNNQPAEETIDSTTEMVMDTIIEQVAEEEIVAEEPVAEEPVKKATKTQTKKDEGKTLTTATHNESKQVGTAENAIKKIASRNAQKAGLTTETNNQNQKVSTEESTNAKLKMVSKK